MDDVLQRMLKVEKAAEELLSQKTKEAQQLQEKTRLELAALRASAQEKLAVECKERLAAAIEQGRQEQQRSLVEAEAKMQKDLADFRVQVATHKAALFRALTVPEG